MKYKSIDLFAGVGGIRLGFDQAFGSDIETVFVSEWDQYAVRTYFYNSKKPAMVATLTVQPAYSRPSQARFI